MRPFEAAIEMLDAIYGIGRRTAEDILAEIDDRLTGMVYQLRRQGIRTSKAEMIELLVWQYVPDQPTEDSRRFWRHSGSWRRERAWPDFVPGPQA